MEDFIVSARKYRPQTFDSVVGQKAITSTLKNAIKSNHLAQAFLFCGSRGVGKTTTARILAKTINCTNRTENIEGCDQCESCKSFNEGASLNVYELDAASNNSVDDIRSLIEQVRIAPQLGTRKVYIIDEVHMLSTAAFNAFLKTLEEPPAHAIFILATTEKHKIIPTILSRCQIFDFNRIRVKDMSDYLAQISVKEGITAEADALHLIAQKADGALRDALSIFDQIVSFAGSTITYKAALENLNILDYDYFFKIVDSAYKEDIPASLLLYNDIIEKGFDGHHFIIGLSEHYRNLLICKDHRTSKLLEVSESIEQRFIEQSKLVDSQYILRCLGVLSKTDVDYKSSKNQRLLVELALMQISSIKSELEKKKRLTDPVKIINYPGQVSLRDNVKKVANSQPSVSHTTTLKKEAKVLTSPTGNLNSTILSIEELKQKAIDVAKGVSEDLSNKPQDSFTYDQLKMYWRSSAMELKKSEKQGSEIVYNIMNKTEPLLNGTVISYEVENKFMEDILKNNFGNEILSYLRTKLNNWSVTLHITVSETNNSIVTNVTNKDIFMQLAQKNINLNTLLNTFNLSVEL